MPTGQTVSEGLLAWKGERGAHGGQLHGGGMTNTAPGDEVKTLGGGLGDVGEAWRRQHRPGIQRLEVARPPQPPRPPQSKTRPEGEPSVSEVGAIRLWKSGRPSTWADLPGVKPEDPQTPFRGVA